MASGDDEIRVELAPWHTGESPRPPGEGAVRIGWDPAAITSGEARPWRIEGDLDWAEIDSLRVLSASLDDGTVVALAALRPRGAAGHDEDVVEAAIRAPDGEPVAVTEALISTEYGPDGSPRRIGVELWRGEEGVPIRVAAEAETERPSSLREADGDVVPVSVRSEGRRGSGLFHLVREG